MSLYGPQTWIAWTSPNGADWHCETANYTERASLLDALEKASAPAAGEPPPSFAVRLMAGEAVSDEDAPLKDVVPCTKLINVRPERTWLLNHDRGLLWQILAEHYFHANEVDKD